MESKISPMMMQWNACKEVAKTAVLLFRMGDFYEAFYEDAEIISKELELTLTKRQEIPMAGIPHHTSEIYIDRLISKGYRVAVAEQTEDPKLAKGLVKREVVRIVTPGTIINSSLLNEKTNNFFVSIFQQTNIYGVARLDLSTGEFCVIEFDNITEMLSEVFRIKPSEILVSKKFALKHINFLEELKLSFDYLLNEIEDWHFDKQSTYHFLTNHFKVFSLDGYGLKTMTTAVQAGGALLQYIQDQLCLPIQHVMEIGTYQTSNYLYLDPITQKNLELTESLYDGSKRNTLLEVLDHTHTPMGARLIRHWIKQPLLCPQTISDRQDVVESFFCHYRILEQIKNDLNSIKDLERLTMKVISGYATPRDLIALRFSLDQIPKLHKAVESTNSFSRLIKKIIIELVPLPMITDMIEKALSDSPPARITDGNVIKPNFNKELDDLRLLSMDSKSWLANYQTKLRDETGIKTLKVGYTRMFGYYIEVSRGQSDKMPSTFDRRQTLVNAERFVSPELKEYETKVLTAEERIVYIETALFETLRKEVAKYSSQIIKLAQVIALLDVLQSLAWVARNKNYSRPVVDAGDHLKIKEGRHPVIEVSLLKEKFVSNDTFFDSEKNRMYLITGPNMAGKSTYLRQVALIVIMSQIGSFVPAHSAHIGIIDKVFTRIGASDDLSRGQSTFMVEMTETANILNNATNRSLVILDEIGRGTSTYDGISIAWSVAEHLLLVEEKRAKTLFATHYWELTKLEEKVYGAINYKVAIQENDNEIVFLRKIIKGSADKSYGIHVAKLAGIHLDIIERAQNILEHLEENANRESVFEPPKPKKTSKKKNLTNEMQLTFF